MRKYLILALVAFWLWLVELPSQPPMFSRSTRS